MTSTKINLTLVGVFVLAGIASLVFALAVLSGRTGDVDTYYASYSNVTGLKFGSQVLFEGYPVGQVERVEPVEDNGRMRFRVQLSVTAGWKIPEDSVAVSTASGVLAPQSIAIRAGSSLKSLEPGATIPSGDAAGLMSSISSVTGKVNEIADRSLVPLMDNMNRQVLLLGEILEKDLRPMMRNTNTVMTQTSQKLPRILDNANTATASLAGASQRVDQLISDERIKSIDRLLVNADGTLTDLRASSAELRKLTQKSGPDLVIAMRELRLTMEALSRNAESTSQNLEATSRNLQEFSRQIRENPARILRGQSPEEAAKAVGGQR